MDIKNKTATVSGLLQEMQVQKQQIHKLHEQLNGLMEAYQNLDNQFSVFQAARIRELGMKVNGGSTSPEDDSLLG